MRSQLQRGAGKGVQNQYVYMDKWMACCDGGYILVLSQYLRPAEGTASVWPDLRRFDRLPFRAGRGLR